MKTAKVDLKEDMIPEGKTRVSAITRSNVYDHE